MSPSSTNTAYASRRSTPESDYQEQSAPAEYAVSYGRHGRFLKLVVQFTAVLLLAFAIFATANVLTPWSRKVLLAMALPVAWSAISLLRRFAVLRYAFTGIAICLLSLNLYGLTQPLRSEELINYRDLQSHHGPQLDCAALEALSQQQDSLDRREFAINAARIVSRIIVFSLPRNRPELARLHHIVPPEKNYLLWLASWTRPHPFSRMEYFEWRRGAARGVGACSQAAMVLCNYLNSHGFDCDVVGLEGHVVTRLNPETDPAAPLVLDPDQGIAFDRPLESLQRQPELVRRRYLNNAHTNATERHAYWNQHAEHLAEAYSSEGNRVYDDAREYFGYATLVDQSRRLKWIFPLSLLLACGLGRNSSHHNSTAAVDST